MGLLYGENCVILASTVFDWSTRVTDGQTDGRTELPWLIRAIATLSRVNTSVKATTAAPFHAVTWRAAPDPVWKNLSRIHCVWSHHVTNF